MSIAIACDRCEEKYHVNTTLAGKRVKCRKCGQPIRVPAAAHPGDHNPDKHEPAAAIASDAAPAAQTGEDSTLQPEPASRSAHHGSRLERWVYRAIAGVAVLGLIGFVVLFLRNTGLLGKPPRQQVVEAVPTPEELLEYRQERTQVNLEAIGRALRAWCDAHRGKYPERLSDVLEVVEIPRQAFESPFGPGGYVYLHFRSMNDAMPPKQIVVYDAAELEKCGGTTLLHASGTIARMSRDDLMGQIEHFEQVRLGNVPEESLAQKPPKKIKKN